MSYVNIALAAKRCKVRKTQMATGNTVVPRGPNIKNLDIEGPDIECPDIESCLLYASLSGDFDIRISRHPNIVASG